MAAVHRTILVLDVVGFGDSRRTNWHQLVVRRELYAIVESAFSEAGVSWVSCHHEDRGDGVMVVIPATVPKSVFVEVFPQLLVTGLREHNRSHPVEERIRLRLALHAGEIHIDDHGVVGRAVNTAFRLLDWEVFRRVQAESDAVLATIASSWFFEEVIWQSHSANRSAYQKIRVVSKETDTIAWICLQDSPSQPELGGAGSPSSAPRQLPADARHFVGRSGQIAQLDRLADSGLAIITAIEGCAGMGKTTLATRWAHRHAKRFPDGQLYVNLRGFDLRDPMTADQALHGFLQALGVAPSGIPADLDLKAAQYRSLLVDRRMLIVLDNARSADQVRPLLPGSSSCMVIITSRNRLDSLVVREGAHRVTLVGLSADESFALLAQRVDPALLEARPDAVKELIDLCACLPLALSIAAARATNPVTEYVRELREERHRLDALDPGGDSDVSLRAVFSWSYEILSSQAARLFRLLGLHPGPSIDLHACCALLGADWPKTRFVLKELVNAHLLSEDGTGRFLFHDLLRAYAHELSEDDPERTEAVRRLLRYYADTALTADKLIQPCLQELFQESGDVLSQPALRTYDEAMAWFNAEHPTLLAVIDFAADEGFSRYAWQLAWVCTIFLRRTGRCEDRISVHRTALTVAKRTGDVVGQVTAGRHLAVAMGRLGQLDGALHLLEETASLLVSLGDAADWRMQHISCARIYEAKGDSATALQHIRQAWELVRDTAEHSRRADVLNVMGRQFSLLGRYSEALDACERALALYTESENSEGQAEVLMSIGRIEHELGRHVSAIGHYLQAIDLDTRLGDRYWEAIGIEHLADVQFDIGELESAEQGLCRSVEMLEGIRHPDANRVRDKLSIVRARAADV